MQRLILSAVLAAISGCASQPAWVIAPVQAKCPQSASKECIGELLAHNVSAAGKDAGLADAIRTVRVALASAGVSEPQSFVELRETLGRGVCLRPDEDLLAAGEAVEMARSARFTPALEIAAGLSDTEARLFALHKITILAAKANNEAAIGRALTLLSEDDKAAYMDALQVRLLNLLEVGDLERAAALQDALLAHFGSVPGNAMPLAQIAISYVTSGHIEDANAFLRKAGKKIPELASEDVVRLLNLMTSAAKGTYPPPQSFFSFSSDEIRLQAYVHLAIYYESTGQTGYSRRIAGDMARFAQKRTFKVGAAESSRAFSKVLIETL